MNLQNKTAVITGGTGSLGRVVTQRFFDAGANIAIPYHGARSMDALPKKILEATDRLLLMQTDLSSPAEVTEFLEHVMRRFNGVHYLANIAGGYAGGSALADVSTEEWDSMISMNLRTCFLMSRGALRQMLHQQFGRIVNMSAMPALTTGVKKGPYAISKQGVISLTEILAAETKGSGITVNAIAPSIIFTDANKKSMPDADSSKWVTPGEIADVIMFLCSDHARSTSGNVVKMFGGV